MSLTLVPHAESWRTAVRALNERMRPKGGFGFFEQPVPDWLPPRAGARLRREYFVAVEADGTARGGYALKHEPASLLGSPTLVASVQGPYSEGAVDSRHARVVFTMIRDMIRRQPLLYGWGLERRASTIIKLFHTFGWRSHATPFLFWVGLPYAARDCRRVTPQGDRCEAVATLDACADAVWERCAPRYAFVVRRDGETLEEMYPSANRQFHRLIIRRGDHPIGWAIVGHRRFRRHPRLRFAHVGVIWDCFAAPEDAAAVIAAAHRYVIRQGAWIVLASASHAAWIAALRARRFRMGRTSRYFLVSPAFAAALDPFEQRAAECFLTFGDGESYQGTLGRAIFDATNGQDTPHR